VLLARLDLDGLRRDAVLLELRADEGQRQLGADQRDVRALLEQVRDTADVVLVAVGEDDALDVVEAVADRGEVRQDHVDAGLVLLGEQHAAVDDHQLADVLEHGHVAAHLAETAESGDAHAVLGQARRCGELGAGGGHEGISIVEGSGSQVCDGARDSAVAAADIPQTCGRRGRGAAPGRETTTCGTPGQEAGDTVDTPPTRQVLRSHQGQRVSPLLAQPRCSRNASSERSARKACPPSVTTSSGRAAPYASQTGPSREKAARVASIGKMWSCAPASITSGRGAIRAAMAAISNPGSTPGTMLHGQCRIQRSLASRVQK